MQPLVDAKVEPAFVLAPIYGAVCDSFRDPQHTRSRVLEHCGDDLTRENLMCQASHLKDFRAPGLLPGIAINTSPTDYRPIKQFILHRFDGQTWVPFGGIIDVSATN